MGANGEIVDLDLNDWYSWDLEIDQIVTPGEFSTVFDPLVHVHGANVVGWIAAGALALSNVDNF